MMAFEYRIESYCMAEKMNELGEQGWELIWISRLGDKWEYIFQRSYESVAYQLPYVYPGDQPVNEES